MTCPPFDQLDRLVAGALDAAATSALREHASTCPSCTEALGRLEEEEQALRRGLPAEPVPSGLEDRILRGAGSAPAAAPAPAPAPSSAAPWRYAAGLLAAAALLLIGFWTGRDREGSPAGTPGDAALVDRVGQFVKEGKLERALGAAGALGSDAAACRARLELAEAFLAAKDPVRAGEALAPVPAAGLDPALGSRLLALRVSAAAQRFEAEGLDRGRLPALHDPAALRLEGPPSLDPAKASQAAAALVAAAAEARDYGALDAKHARVEALARAARYALGEAPFRDLPPLDDPEVRFRVGELLFRERQFARAVEAWTPILGSDERALRRVLELALLRKHAPKELAVLDAGAEACLGRNPKLEAEIDEEVRRLYATSRPMTVAPTEMDEPVHKSGYNVSEAERFADQLYLLLEYDRFRFVQPGRAFTTGRPARVELQTAFRGPIRARLWKVPTLEAYEKLDAAGFVAGKGGLVPAGDWEVDGGPLGPVDGTLRTLAIDVPAKDPGLYVVSAEARYCPVVAVARLAVSDVGLLVQAARDRLVVYSAHRTTGAAIPSLKVKGTVVGRYAVRPSDLVPSDDSDAKEYRRGFDDAWAGKAPEVEAVNSYRSGYGRAADLKKANPDSRAEFAGATDTDGLLLQAAPAWNADYEYVVTVLADDGKTPAEARVEVPGSLARRALKSLVLTDRPVYRPGDRVYYKGIVRTEDAEGLHAYEGTEAIVEFRNGGRTIHAETRPVNEFGTFSGEFALPAGVYVADVHAAVNHSGFREVFQVVEYRKAEAELVVTAPAEAVSGGEAEIWIEARLLSGDPLPGIAIEVRMTESPLSPARSAEAAATAWFHAPPAREGKAVELERREVVTDSKGRAVLRYRSDPGESRQVIVRGRALDPSRREFSGSAAFAVRSAAATASVEPDRACYFPGETARIRFRAPGHTAVKIEEVAEAKDRLSVSAALDAGGSGAIDVRIADPVRPLRYALKVGDAWDWAELPLVVVPRPERSAGVSISVDRPIHRPGETAVLAVAADAPGQHVLLLSGGGGVSEARLLRLEKGAARLDRVLGPADGPNLTYVAVAVSGDAVHEARAELVIPPTDRFLTVDVQTDKPEYGPGEPCSATVKVWDSAGREVPDCEISLSVVDEGVYAVQEDTTPDLREWFHRSRRQLELKRGWTSIPAPAPFLAWKAPTFVRGLSSVYDALGIGGGGGGRYGGRFGGRKVLTARGGGGMATESAWAVRERFVDTAHWSAHLRTGPDGAATVKFAWPDNLTAFRFTARGLAKDGRVGSIRQRAVVRREFSARLALPRTLQEGDAFVAQAFLHNSTDRDRTVKVSLATPLKVSGGGEEIAVPARGMSRVEWLVEVGAWRPEAEFELRAEGDGVRDGLRVVLPVRRHGAPFMESRAGSVAAGRPVEEAIALPAGAIRGTLSLKLKLDPGVHAAVVEGLEPLIEYPYGCTEQTMSRFLPAVAVDRALGPKVKHRYKDKLPEVLASGLARLYSLQHPDGGWGWWAKDATSIAMTAYVLHGLSVCKEAGVGVDRSAVDRAAARLRTGLSDLLADPATAVPRVPMSSSISIEAYAAFALASHDAAFAAKSAATARLVRTVADRSRTSAADEAFLGLACRRAGLKEAEERLWRTAEGRTPSEVPVVSALLAWKAARGADVSREVLFLLSRRTGKGWRSTMESAYALLGLAAVLDRPSAVESGPGRVTVKVNGKVARELVLPDQPDPAFDGEVAVTEAREGEWGDRVVVELTYDGTGSGFYSLALRGLVAGTATEPLSRGLEVTRRYYVSTRDGWRPVEGAVAAGSRVLVQLSVTTPVERSYVRITDPRPAGLEPVERLDQPLKVALRTESGLTDRLDLPDLEGLRGELRRARGDRRRESAWALGLLRRALRERRFVPAGELRPADLAKELRGVTEHGDWASHQFVGRLPAGTSHCYYEAVAETAGALRALPPDVEPMYDPEVRGVGVGSSWTVTDGRGVPAAATAAELPPGVGGLAAVLDRFEAAGTAVDADAVLDAVSTRLRIGSALLAGLAAAGGDLSPWLKADAETSAAGLELAARVAAAAEDTRTRLLALEAMAAAESVKPEWAAAVEAALADASLEERVFSGVRVGDLGAVDRALAWASADRALRLGALAARARIRGSAAIQPGSLRTFTARGLLGRVGATADPDREARWLLAQGVTASEPAEAFLERVAAELGLALKLHAKPAEGHVAASGEPLGKVLDRVLGGQGLYYRIDAGTLRVGRLEDILK